MPDRRKGLAFIIGTGALGPIALKALPRDTYSTKVFALPDCPDTPGHSRQDFALEDLHAAFADLAKFAPDLVCMIGGVTLTASHRHNLARYFTSLFPTDAITQSLDPNAPAIGDQTASLMMLKIITNLGAKLIGIHQLVPDLVTPLGQIGSHPCPDSLTHQIPDAIARCLAHARADKGQAIVIQNKTAHEKEDLSGTAAMLARHAKSAASHQPAILVKCARPDQPLAIDMPTIGPDTIDQAADANIALILLEANRSLMVDRPALIAKADAANIALLGVVMEGENG